MCFQSGFRLTVLCRALDVADDVNSDATVRTVAVAKFKEPLFLMQSRDWSDRTQRAMCYLPTLLMLVLAATLIVNIETTHRQNTQT